MNDITKTQTSDQASIQAMAIPLRVKRSNYPKAIQTMMGARLQGREKRTLGDFFGLSNFGVNLTKLAPKAVSSLFHSHSRQDELICILRGHPVLQLHEGRVPLTPGMCAGFKSGSGHAHCLINESNEEVLYLEIGDRTAGDEITYPNDDLQTRLQNGRTVCLHKDGSPY